MPRATYSLNEIDALARKAARGRGYPWGLAEEAGKAVRLLCACGLPGLEVLSGLLADKASGARSKNPPIETETGIHAEAGSLCPLLTGAWLADGGSELLKEPPTVLVSLVQPLLLVPFLHRLAGAGDQVIAATWPEARLLAGPQGLGWSADPAALLVPVADLNCSVTAQADLAMTPPSAMAPALDPALWSQLERLAHRTYVPASEASRTGAGAEVDDNN